MDHGRPRRRSGHRRGERSGEGVCRGRRAAQQGDRGDPRRTEDEGAVASACARVADQEVTPPHTRSLQTLIDLRIFCPFLTSFLTSSKILMKWMQLISLAALVSLTGARAKAQDEDKLFEQLTSEYLKGYFAANPIAATGIGVHDYDN